MTKDELAQQTAEYIADVLIPAHADRAAIIDVRYVDGNRPPHDVDEIKAALLAGRIWISWIDDRVSAAMRELHATPA